MMSASHNMAHRRSAASFSEIGGVNSTLLRVLPSWVVLALIAVLAVWAYWPALHGSLLWDDAGHVTHSSLQSADGLRRIWFEIGATQQYYPLLHSFFWVQHKLWGDDPFGYHVVDLLLHLAAALLVYVIMRRLKIPGALLATAIFALHPVQAETVAWITEQKNTLSAVFYLGALLAYLHFDARRTGRWYALALGLFFLGLLSKTITATLPAALLVILWWQRGQHPLATGSADLPRLSWRHDVLPLLPFFVLAALGGGVTAWFERKLIGAEGEAFDLTLLQRTLLAGRVIWFYLGNIFWPHNLMFFYPRWKIDAAEWWQWSFSVAATGLSIFLWRIRHWSRAPLAGWLFFVGTLFPVLGFLNVYPFRFSFVADHFQYLASLGVMVPVAGMVASSLARWSAPAKLVGLAVCSLLVGGLAWLTRQQAPMYVDVDTLYHTTITRNPDCWLAYNNLGLPLLLAGDYEQAVGYFKKALELNPDYDDACNNMGKALITRGEMEEGLRYFQKAARLKPSSAVFQHNVGNTLLTMGRTQEAIQSVRESLRLAPTYDVAHGTLGVALFKTGDFEGAMKEFQEAIRLRPNYCEAYSNLAGALISTHHPQEALEYLRQAIEIQPDYSHAWVNLSFAQRDLGHIDEAIVAARRAIEVARSQGNDRVVRQMEGFLVELQRPTERSPDFPAPALPPVTP